MDKTMIWGGIILAALFAVLVFSGGKQEKTQELTGVNFLETYQTTPDAILLDVRTPEEFASGHLEGAENIDFENPTFQSEILKLDKTKSYFVYCRSGNRSGQAITMMESAGLNNLFDLQGGLVSNQNVLQLVTAATPSKEYVVDESDMINEKSLIEGIEKSSLNENEINGLLRMREEEKLARDVYTTLGTKWGMKIFLNIASSEQTHTDAIKSLLDRYAIPDPSTDSTVGVFQSTEMQKLYNDLVVSGTQSLSEALVVGATIEDLDIHDLSTLMKETDKKDILVTYGNLQKGSRNHLRAFLKNISSTGGVYSPQYISAEEYSAIISSPSERGRI